MNGSIHSTNNHRVPTVFFKGLHKSHPPDSLLDSQWQTPAGRTAIILPPTPTPAERARRVHSHTLSRKREKRKPTDTFLASAATEPSCILLLCVCVSGSAMSNSATPWTVARQASLCMGFSRQEHWSRLPCPPPGDLPDPGIELSSPAL